jgi:hypothetical protein
MWFYVPHGGFVRIVISADIRGRPNSTAEQDTLIDVLRTRDLPVRVALNQEFPLTG